MFSSYGAMYDFLVTLSFAFSITLFATSVLHIRRLETPSLVICNRKMAYETASAMQGESLRKGPWHEEEDERLITFVKLLGSRRWDYVARVSGITYKEEHS